MLNSQTILGLYKEKTLSLVVQWPPKALAPAEHLLEQAFKKFQLFQKRGYLNYSGFLVKCFHLEKLNLYIIGLFCVNQFHKIGKLFNKIIETASKSNGLITLNLSSNLETLISENKNVSNWRLYDFEQSRKKAKKKENKEEKEMSLGLDLNIQKASSSESIFGFLNVDYSPENSRKVIRFI